MLRTIYLKFLLAYLIFGFFGLVAVSTFVSSMTMEQLRREKADSMYREANLIANTFAADLYSNQASLDTVKKEIDALGAYMDATVWIINPSGRIVLDSSAPINIDRQEVVEDFDPTRAEGAYDMEGDFFGYFRQDMLSVFAPITANYSVNGYVVIHYPMSSLKTSTDSLMGISYMFLWIMLFLSMIILYFFTEIVYLPLRKIIKATEQYANGNMHYELQVESEDELGYLAAALSYMSGRIARSEDSQKKFIANVSHDFRSPLTSIRGYLTAMIDGTIPQEQYGKYLGIVLNETERLTKLTNGLLTLNSLGTDDMMLNKTHFDINPVIRSVAASFGGICLEKKLEISLVLTGDEMYVNADMEKIQQVLYNLVDNALKFSNEEGVVRIETTERGKKLHVSVKDNGIGIPRDSLELIWSRFYKTDLSRGRDKKGTGLGLSIVREILRAHGENIDVISTEGVGSEFIFTLEAVEEEDE